MEKKKTDVSLLKPKFEKRFEESKAFFKEQGFIIEDKLLRRFLCSRFFGYPVLAVGPTGCGKTDFFDKFAKFEGGSYEYASLNGSITIHDLTQDRVIEKDGTFGERDMVLAKWLRAGQKGISILQLDEVNAAKPETLLALHPIMDIKGCLVLPYTGEVLKVNQNCILVMSCNEGDEYAGVNAMNMAFQNRYNKIHFRYLQGDILANMLTEKTGLDLKKTKSIVKVWENYMTTKEMDQPVVSIRVLERWCMMAQLIGVREAGEATFGSLIAKDEEDLKTIAEGTFFVNLPKD